jgi:hypothetical protein
MDEQLKTELLDSLRSMCWSCLRREVAHLVLAYQAITRLQPDPIGREIASSPLGGERFAKFCAVWREWPSFQVEFMFVSY